MIARRSGRIEGVKKNIVYLSTLWYSTMDIPPPEEYTFVHIRL
jgi:hypothetical protein